MTATGTILLLCLNGVVSRSRNSQLFMFIMHKIKLLNFMVITLYLFWRTLHNEVLSAIFSRAGIETYFASATVCNQLIILHFRRYLFWMCWNT